MGKLGLNNNPPRPGKEKRCGSFKMFLGRAVAHHNASRAQHGTFYVQTAASQMRESAEWVHTDIQTRRLRWPKFCMSARLGSEAGNNEKQIAEHNSNQTVNK